MSRILLHSLVFPPERNSTAYLMADLATGLRHLGHDVTVLTTTPHYHGNSPATLDRQSSARAWAGLLHRTEYQGIPVWHVTVRSKRDTLWRRAPDFIWFHLVSLAASLRTIPTQDVVIATSPPLTIGLISALLGARWRCASVYRVAELFPDLLIRHGAVKSRALINGLEWVERMVYRHNTMIVVIAEQFARVVRERGVAPDRVRVIPDFVDTDFFLPLPRDSAFAREHQLAPGFVVMYAGNIGLVQDWESVLAAAAALKDQPITHVIVGDGTRHEWLGQEIARRGLVNVKLMGYQPRELMPAINASCDLALIPMTRSGARDGFPSKVYSLMACGKPILASTGADSEMAAMIGDARCGRVVTPEEPAEYIAAVRRAFAERDELQAEGLRGRQFVEQRYSRAAVAGAYATLIDSLTQPS
ncbi:MAG: glycosyltransferase family 4 protein [Acidobacteria bacterium]|nr:glycosyltransferase family 4 protein [Acidobacteriota bacterium]